MSASAKLQILIEAKDGASAVFGKTGQSLTTLGTSSKTAGSALGALAGDVAKVATGVGGVLVAGIGAAVKQFASFDHGMSAVKAASGATAGEMSQLSAAALALGQDTQLAGIGATDAASAMEELAKGGVSVADQLGGATKGALLLASAGAIGVGEAAGLATKAMNIFGLSGAEVAHVADLLSAGANKSATDVGQLGAAFNQSAAVAKNAGLSIEELTGTLAFLAQRGLEGSDAGTSLKTALLALQAPTDKAANLMEDLGINVRDAEGRMLPFADVADVLRDRLSGLSDAQRDAALKTIFGNDAIRVGIALYEGGGGAIRDWTKQVDDAGNAARTGATKNDNLAGSLDQLQANYQTAAIQIGGKFAPVVRTAADELGKLVTTIANSSAAQQALDTLASKGVAALTAVSNKVKDPQFLAQMQAWGTTALGVGTAVVDLAGKVGQVLGPVVQHAAEWFTALDDGGKRNVVTFGLVAAAALRYRSELATLGGAITTVIGQFAAKEAAKKTLTSANVALAGSAGKTATAFGSVGSAAGVAGALLIPLAIFAGNVADSMADADAATQKVAKSLSGDLATALAGVGQTSWLDALIEQFNGHSVAAEHANEAVHAWAQGVNGAVPTLEQLQTQLDLVARAQQNATNASSADNLVRGQVFKALYEEIEARKKLADAQKYQDAALAAGVNASLTALEANGVVTTRAAEAARAAAIAASGMGTAFGTAAAAMGATATAATGLGNALGVGARGFSAIAAAAASATPPIAASGLAFGAFASAIAGAQGVVAGYDKEIAGLGAETGHLGGYLSILQGEWDRLNEATDNGKNVTAAQAARYAELAPLIQYLNAQTGVYRDRTVSAAEAGVRAMQALDGVNAAASAGAAHQADYAASLQTSAGATNAAALAATIASIKYDEFGQAVGTVPPVVPVDTSAAQLAATIASIKYDEFGQAINEVPKSVSVDTGAAVGAAFNAAAAMGRISVAIAAVPKSINIVANVDISGALNQIQQLRNNMPSSPAKEGPFAASNYPDFGAVLDTFGEGVSRAIHELPRLRTAIDAETADLQKKIAESASAMAKAVTDTLGAMTALSSFNFARNTPSGAQTSGLLAFVSGLTSQIVEAARAFTEDGLKAANAFADTASKVVGLVGGALAAFAGLATYTAIPTMAIYDFGKTLRALVNDLSLLASQVTQAAADEAAAFSEGVGKVVAMIGGGVEAFTKLGRYTAIPSAAIYAFGKTLRAVVNDFALLAEQVTQEATDVAAKFASGAGTVVDTVGKGIAAFVLLGSYEAPATAAIYAFGKTIRAIVNDFSLLAEQVSQAATDQAARFATGAGAVVGIIGNAVEGLSKLSDFVAPSETAINNFVYAVYAAVRKLGAMAQQMSTEGLAAAGALGEAAGSVFGALKDALSVFTDLATLVVPSDKAIRDFAIAVAYTVSQIGQLADQLGRDGIKRAQDFGASVGAIFGSLKSSMDTLTNLAKFKDVAQKAFESLAAGLVGAVEQAQGMVNQAKDLVLLGEEYRSNMLKAAALFASGQSLGGDGKEIGKTLGEGVASGVRDALEIHSPSQVMVTVGKQVIAGLVAGLDSGQQAAAKAAADVASALAKAVQDTLAAATALGKLDVGTLPGAAQITGLLGFARQLVTEAQAAAATVATQGVEAAAKWAEGAGKIVAFFGSGAEALGKLVGFVAPPVETIRGLAASISAAMADLSWVAEQIGTEASDLAGQFSEGAAKVLDLIGKGVASFAGVFGFAKPENFTGIYYLNQAVEAALNDLAIVAERVTLASSTLAGQFAEGAGKVVDAIAKGGAAFAGLDTFRFTEPLNLGILHLNKALQAAVADFAAIVDLIGTAATGKAADFATAALKVVDTIAKGVVAFKDLDAFRAPTRAALDAFLTTIGQALRGIADAAKGMGTEGLKLAGEFADAGTKAAGLLGAGVAGVANLASFVAPPRAVVDALLATIQYAIGRFGEMARLVGSEGTKVAGEFGTATQAVLGGVKAAIDTFILLDTATVPKTGDLSDLVEAVKGTMANVARAAATLGSETIKQATDFGNAAKGIFDALKTGLDLFVQIDKPGGWPTTDWLQPLIELMRGMLGRGALLLGQAQELKGIAEQFAATVGQAQAAFTIGAAGGGGILSAGSGLLANVGYLGGGGGGGASITINLNGPVYGISDLNAQIREAVVMGLSRDSSFTMRVTGPVTTEQNRTVGYSISG